MITVNKMWLSFNKLQKFGSEFLFALKNFIVPLKSTGISDYGPRS